MAPPPSEAAPASAVATPLLHRPLPQAVLCLAGYMIHVCVLSRRSLPLGGGGMLGWDTIVGLGVLGAAARQRVASGLPAVPTWLWASKSEEEAALRCADFSRAPARERVQLLVTCAMLLVAPLAFSIVSGPLVEVTLSLLVLCGAPLNAARMMSGRLILEQALLYFALGTLARKRHPGVFTTQWVRLRWRAPWLAPVLGGYAASLALFNLVEPLNQALLPGLAYASEGIVAQLANPSDASPLSLLLAAVAPCVGAPIFEEYQSRAFIMQALTAALPLSRALLISGVLFGAQHLQIGLVLPLAVTGCTWAALYIHSGNLLVPILVHALWNAVSARHCPRIPT